MNLPPNRFSRLWLIFSLLVIFILAACTDFEAEEGYNIASVNSDLSGEVNILFVFNAFQYSNLQTYYGTLDFGGLLARDIANELGWSDFTWNENVVSGEYVLGVTQEFRNAADFYNNILTDIDPVSEGQIIEVAPETIPIGINRQDGLFNTVYTIYFLSGSRETYLFPIHFVATLPGIIVETNGDIGEDGQIFWYETFQAEEHYAVNAMLSEYEVAFGADLAAATNNLFTITVTAPASQLELLARLTRSGNTEQILAERWAESLGLGTYVVDSHNQSGRQSITLTSTFANRQALIDQINQIPLFGDMRVQTDDLLFSSGLTLQGTLNAWEEAFDQPDSISLKVQMPGEIMDENGEKTGTNEQEWVWNAATDTPIHLSSALLTDYQVDVHTNLATHELAFTLTTDPAQLAQFAAANPEQTPAEAVANLLTSNIGLTEFAVTEGEEEGQQWVQVSTEFASITALTDYLNGLPLFSNLVISQTQAGLQTQYTLEGAMQPANGTNPIAFYVFMPGKLLESNGEASDSHLIWRQTDEEITLAATSQDALWRQPAFLGGASILLVCLCGGTLLAVGGVTYSLRRKRTRLA